MALSASEDDEQAAPILEDIAVLVGQCPVAGPELLSAIHEPIYDALAARETQVHNDIAPDCDWAKLGQLR